MIKRFEIYLVAVEEGLGRSPKNTRPAVVVSPDEMNRHSRSALIAPISSFTAEYPTRIRINFLNGDRLIVLDQLRSVDRRRLVKKIGEIDDDTKTQVIERLQEMFA